MAARKKSEYSHLYRPAQQTCVFHEHDKDLDNIVIKLPSPPPMHKIDGYGKHPDDQFFVRPEMPPRLKELNDKGYIDVENYWNDIVNDFEYYKEELWFIDQHWERRINGYWFFNNGVPTWITGHHYMLLTAFKAENDSGSDYLDYRDRDRRFHLAVWYCQTTTEAPFKFKIVYPEGEIRYTSSLNVRDAAKKKNAKIEFGHFLIDMGHRTVIGMTWNKYRREGATTKAENIRLDIATRYYHSICGAQSATETAAEENFKNILLRGWRGYPFYFKPINENNPDPTRSLKLKPQSKKGASSSKATIVEALYSEVNYKASTENAYDGKKLRYYHSDEPGKTKEADVERRWMKYVKQTLTLYANRVIIGFSLHTTTVGDMEKEGGANWKKMCMGSHWGDRDDNGQTSTGLVNFFIDSADGIVSDKFGNSTLEAGVRQIENQIQKFLDAEDEAGLIDFKKDMPRCFRDCFSVLTGNKRFDMQKINDRLNQFIFEPNKKLGFYRLEYYPWMSAEEHQYNILKLPTMQQIMSGEVKVRPVPFEQRDAHWEISALPEEGMANKSYRGPDGLIHPGNVAIWSMGSDMFKIGEDTVTEKGSNGANAIYRKFAPLIEKPGVNPFDIDPDTGDFYRITGRFNAIYNMIPPTTDEFCEQTLMAAILYGCKCFPEINLTDVWKWFARRGFINYLQFRIDVKTGKELKQPGQHTGTNDINTIFNLMREYISRCALVENHLVLLEQCRDIDRKMGDFDVFTAAGLALVGDSEIIKHFVEVKRIDLSRLFKRF